MSYQDWIDSDYRVIGINPMLPDGSCTCARGPDCWGAGKHPRAANWQHTPEWSDDQLESFDLIGYLDAYGILCSGLIVVDVDARNGGLSSYNKLIELIPEIQGSGCIVNTGSADGSMHLFFKAPEGVSLKQHANGFDGIDFKSSGFVVGYGSPHKSGNKYELAVGSPAEIDDAPSALIALLEVKHTVRAKLGDSESIDVSNEQLHEIINLLDPDCDYDTWIKSGMALHNATGGSNDGLLIWDEWSQKGSKYCSDGDKSPVYKWHTFGKSASQVTIGTLISLTGWSMPVTFKPSAELMDLCADDSPVVDLLRPHGLVGEIAKYINSMGIRKREHLAVQASLYIVSACGGLRHHMKFGKFDVRSNVYMFGVAGTGSGKNTPFSVVSKIMKDVGIAGSRAGNFKSQQEVVRNLIEHQAANYIIDEAGEVFAKVSDGNASYLDGLIAELMTMYSQSSGYYGTTGDVKREIFEGLKKEYAAIAKAESMQEATEEDVARAMERLEAAENGISQPFIQIQGFTTPEKFEALVTPEAVLSGFMGRCLIAKETNDVPNADLSSIEDYDTLYSVKNIDTSVPGPIISALSLLYNGGHFDSKSRRVERKGDLVNVRMTRGAHGLYMRYFNAFEDMAKVYDSKTKMPGLVLRAPELMCKIALIMGMPAGVVSEQDMEFAHQYAMQDLKLKTHLANSHNEDASEALMSKLLVKMSNLKEEARSAAVMFHKQSGKKARREDVQKALDILVSSGHAKEVRDANASNGKVTIKYYKA